MAGSNGIGRRQEVAPESDRQECSPQHVKSPSTADSDIPLRNSSGVAFWNVNIPEAEWTDECPEYLEYAFKDHKDRAVLLTLDPDYHRQTWDDVQRLIYGNRLDLFKRVPSQLRLYRAYCHKLVKEYGSIMNFVLKERLHWEDLNFSPSPPFANPGTPTFDACDIES